MASCVPTAQLEAFVRNKLAAGERPAVEKHLASCKKCAGEVRRIRNEEALFADLKGAVGEKASLGSARRDATVSSAPSAKPGTKGGGGHPPASDDPPATIAPSADPKATLSSDTTRGRGATPAFDPRGPMSVESDDVMATISSDAPSKPSAARSAGAPSQLFEIEGYEILSELSRGGQGTVYKAVQKATKRTVALKVLLSGAGASKRQLARFEREIDLAAGLRHPNIITVYDSGVTGAMHYLVMEFVRSDRLDVYLSRKKPTLETTLKLFIKICGAVNYAHRHGVIHRDLKPGNILVDSNGEPYILDFGLAKAIGKDTLQGRGLTLTSEFVGTLAYASPEQTEGRPELIDVRTDVYSLGVILYEMVTGHLPYSVAGAIGDVLRNIANAAPERPSTWHSKSKSGDDEGIPINSHRIKDDLETIILKALCKEPERRYQSLDVLATDIDRFMRGEAIDAKRDSALYVLRKMAARYRVKIAVFLAFFVLIISFGAISFHQHKNNEKEWARVEEAARKVRESLDFQAKVADATQEALHTGVLAWYLRNLDAGAMDRVKAIQTSIQKPGPHAEIMKFLLDDQYSIDDLLNNITPALRPTAHYVNGERLLRAGRQAEAFTAFELAAASGEPGSRDFMVLEARSRIAQLKLPALEKP